MEDSGVRLATADDIRYIAEHLRKVDEDEIRAAHGVGSELALIVSKAASGRQPCYAWLDAQGTPLAVSGIAESPLMPEVGIPWMLGTDGVANHTRRLLKESRRIIAEALGTHYSYLYNYVHEANEPSKRFLRAMGFKLHEPRISGPQGELFRKFDMGDLKVCMEDADYATLITTMT